MNLKEQLIREDKTRWLDVGSGGNFEGGFHYVDTFPEGLVSASARSKYFRLDLVNTSDSALGGLGTFDFIRMQHVFEHFTYEDGQRILRRCAQLLKDDGAILITVPNLKMHIARYLKHEYRNSDWPFKEWAIQRIPENAPDSFYFSIFSHSMIYESHKWCYDFEGLQFQLAITGLFTNIQELTINHPLSSIPFTHNRPEEDVCVLAYKHRVNSESAVLESTQVECGRVKQANARAELSGSKSGSKRPRGLRRYVVLPARLQILRAKDKLRLAVRLARDWKASRSHAP